MAITRYAGDVFVGLSTDTKPTNVADGARFYETDTKKEFIKVSGSWAQMGGGTASNAFKQYCVVSRNANSIDYTSNQEVSLLLDRELVDVGNLYDVANKKLVAPETGTYLIRLSISYTLSFPTSSSSLSVSPILYKNGVYLHNGHNFGGMTSSSYVPNLDGDAVFEEILDLNANDSIEPRANVTTSTGSVRLHFSPSTYDSSRRTLFIAYRIA